MTPRSLLYEHPEHPDQWIGGDSSGELAMWPRERGGWAKRVVYRGGKRSLAAVDPSLARGSGWPGAGPGRRRLAGDETGSPVTIKLDDTRRGVLNDIAEREGSSVSVLIREGIDMVIAARQQ